MQEKLPQSTQFLSIGCVFFGAAFSGVAMAEERPVALVEHISGASDAAIQAFDYVYKNDKIDLRPGGELRLAYFDNCETESFNGGLIKLKIDSAKITKGGVSTKEMRPCQTSALALSSKAREAGVSVKRVTPFPESEWREVSVVTATPRFIWPKNEDAETQANVRVYYLDSDPAELVWQGNSAAHQLVYPGEAPLLKIGMPYEVVISYEGEPVNSVVFSIDPNLELPDTPLANSVPLGL